jgi:hypothetical protein
MKLRGDYIIGEEESKREEKAIHLILGELHFSTNKYGPFNSTHEAYGVLKEEVDEFWDACKTNNMAAMQGEMVQVAAMAMRFILDAMRSTENG